MLSFTINFDRDTGPDAFDGIDDVSAATYFRIENTLGYHGVNSETGDLLFMDPPAIGTMFPATFAFTRDGSLLATGTFAITPAPEPRTLFLLLPVVALVGLRWRPQRHRV